MTRVRLFRFRNYGEATVQFGSSLNVLAGPNAQGKTNLLEAVATLALTRSPRAATAADLLQWGSDRCQIEATVHRGTVENELGSRFERHDGSDRVSRSTTVDGKPRQARSVLGLCPVVLFWPDDLQLVKAGPEGRRRLLDTLLSQLDPRATTHLLRFRRVLEQRNALLHQIRAEGRGREGLAAFTAELVHHGARVTVARARVVESLSPVAAAALRDLSGGRERLELRFVSSAGADVSDDHSAERTMLEALQRRSAEEEARGVTVAGPHRDDIEVLLDGRPARHTASQGQQRSIVLACKLAGMRYVAATSGITPVVLLDDVLSELDQQRRAELLTALSSAAHQVLVTTTEPLPDAGLFSTVHHFTVRGGTVNETAD
ncbi:MAG: DNA replication/repair protein RecF [Candidatus Dormibacteraeota bacterium]|nr:DNA replication/repair protein RecF [Candidatus Dormibacteraeota bacterium]